MAVENMNDYKWIWSAGLAVAIATATGLIGMYAHQESLETRMDYIEKSLQSAHDVNGRQWERIQELQR